jgi:gamma-glutamylcyclotransferase (GGCT)/AIG2-like uncharacterized protein YtfP
VAPQAQGPLTIHLFVYGTLAPGHEAWPVLQPWVVDDGRVDAVVGRLFDTGRGYPAAVFEPGATGVVHGTVVTLDPVRVAEALIALDRYEGREYQRIAVRTVAGIDVATYAWAAVLDDCRHVESGRWADAETPPPTGR